jgi:DNA-binding IclR family transcriptional regulator
VPLEAGSWGKTYYAATGAPLPAKLTGYTPSTITDRTKFEAELKQVRTLGYAIDDEEYDLGVGGVCARYYQRFRLRGAHLIPRSAGQGRRAAVRNSRSTLGEPGRAPP